MENPTGRPQLAAGDEPRWHASLAVLAALLLYITLPPKLTIGPVWVAPLLVLALLVPLSVLVPRRHSETARTRFWSIVLIAIVNFFNVTSVALLIGSFFHPLKVSELNSAGILLRHGMQIWFTNILVFALWFWELDGDGPEVRAHAPAAVEFRNADFLFPQMQVGYVSGKLLPCVDANWKPQFFDYLYLAFTNATAFSPADVMPLSRWAKCLMLIEALISLVTIAIVLARSVSQFSKQRVLELNEDRRRQLRIAPKRIVEQRDEREGDRDNRREPERHQQMCRLATYPKDEAETHRDRCEQEVPEPEESRNSLLVGEDPVASCVLHRGDQIERLLLKRLIGRRSRLKAGYDVESLDRVVPRGDTRSARAHRRPFVADHRLDVRIQRAA